MFWNTRAKDERGETIFINSRDAALYINEEFYAALNVFCMCENLGCLPFAGGWAEQPEWITQALAVLKVERYRVDEEERAQLKQREEDRKKHVK